jgi:hypothetical protein
MGSLVMLVLTSSFLGEADCICQSANRPGFSRSCVVLKMKSQINSNFIAQAKSNIDITYIYYMPLVWDGVQWQAMIIAVLDLGVLLPQCYLF